MHKKASFHSIAMETSNLAWRQITYFPASTYQRTQGHNPEAIISVFIFMKRTQMSSK
jgi:hypothetical protein